MNRQETAKQSSEATSHSAKIAPILYTLSGRVDVDAIEKGEVFELKGDGSPHSGIEWYGISVHSDASAIR